MSFKIWKFLILLIFKFEICISSFEEEYPGVVLCQDDKLQQENMLDTKTQIKIFEQFLKKNCTHMQGSLYIRGFRELPNGWNELRLDSIREIDGHLIIEANDLERISFKNLKIIRGASFRGRQLVNSSFANFALDVTGNSKLLELDLSALRSIRSHNVIFSNNPVLQYLPHKINWEELFADPTSQKIFTDYINSSLSNRDNCSNQCHRWFNANDTYCWGPSAEQCQAKVLCGPKYSKSCRTCLYKDGEELPCCYEQCLGGCYGSGSTECVACREMVNGKKCIETCPGRYTGGVGGNVMNKEFKFHTGFFCSKQCPAMMLPEDSICVYKCSDGYFKEKNNCSRCYGDKCKKENLPCELINPKNDESLNKENLLKLTNCTKLIGYIILTKHSFARFNVTVPMLYDNLAKLEDLEGGFYYSDDKHLKNLTFLKNLKIFTARNLHSHVTGQNPYNRFTVTLTALEFLGLKSLKRVVGKFAFHKNRHLCYMNFPSKEVVSGQYRYDNSSNCSGKVCSEQCANNTCWGPGNNMCYECKYFDAGGVCVTSCTSVKGYYLPKNSTKSSKTCLKCHKECQTTCKGPGPHQCLKGCLNKRENNTCVTNCSNSYYSEGKNCRACHANCSKHNEQLCTGPSSVPGNNGCTKCVSILLDRKYNILDCVKTCPEGTFKLVKEEPYISKYFINNNGYTCYPCHPYCSKCQTKSDKKDECLICTGFWHRNTCKQSCPKDDSYGIDRNNSQKICKTCDPQCRNGCTGSLSTNCTYCKSKKIYLPDGKQFYCNESCPLNRAIEEIETKTKDIICLSIWDSKAKREEIKRTKITIAVVVSMLVLVIIVIVIIVICLRKKATSERLEAELKARYSNLTEPSSKDEDMLNKPPNMGRLVIVSKEDLTFEDESRPLGFGAFGYVYKGKWKIPKGKDTLLKKTSSDFFLPVAIKVIKNMGNEEIESIMQEAKMMASVSHMHCLRFIGVCLSYEKPCLISSYVKEGSLDKYLIRNKSKITSLIMLSWSEQIADGMLYLTNRNIIHRDLAARNVLVSRLECVQITDFGLAKMLESTKDKEIIIKTGKVPIRWLAIETLTEGKYSHETDVWAYGVTLWEIFTFGKVPYEDQATHDIFDFVLKGGRLSQPDICSLDVYILMVNCWLERANLRPDFQSLMKTFVDYCKNPGRYLSIQGDPYEIPSPTSNIEMTNLNNPYYGDHFTFSHTTAETMLPLLNNRESMDRDVNDFTHDNKNGDLVVPMSDNEQLPTRSMNRTSNLFKRFQENRQPQNSINTRNNNNTPRLVSLASQEEPMFRNHSPANDEDPRYVADPTDKTIKIRQALRSNLLQETPRFSSNTNSGSSFPFTRGSASPSPHISQDVDGYLEPVTNRQNSRGTLLSNGTDEEGYLEPVKNSSKGSLSYQDEYMVPSHPTTPRESLLNNKSGKNSNAFKLSKDYLTMDDEKSPVNLHNSKSLVDDEYLEPKPLNRQSNSPYR